MPTIKQKKAAKAMVENGGVVSKAMIKAGYSENTAKTPQKLTESDGWKELMQEYLPDSLLGEKHRELLEVPKKVRTFVKGDLSTEYEELDTNAIKAGLDMAYKLKGRYGVENPDEKPKNNTTYNFIFNAETQEKVKEIDATIKAQLIKPHVESV